MDDSDVYMSFLRFVCFLFEGLYFVMVVDDRLFRIWVLELKVLVVFVLMINGFCCMFFLYGGIIVIGMRDGYV